MRFQELPAMADEPKLSKIEILKDNSRQLRGTMGEELRAEIDSKPS